MGGFITPRLAKGSRDFSPGDMSLRNHIISTIRQVFTLFGFEQIETPAMENLETLTGKYGDEGDKLIFKILNSGDYLKNANDDLLQLKNSDKLIPMISEKALRYDLTVPFARYVVQHRNDITFPFRRYQIQPVWRADRPQKGRYREFYQCDADVIGTDSLLIEFEFLQIINRVFAAFSIPAQIRLNSRKILYGFCEDKGIEDRFEKFTTILDKLDKKSWDELSDDFRAAGFGEDVISATEKFKELSGKPFTIENLDKVSSIFSQSETGKKGVEELKTICRLVKPEDLSYVEVVLDLTLARGLNYYTGVIVEVVSPENKIGSLCGGGRYDDLTGIFGLPGLSGMGISFGIDRIFDILQETKWNSKDGDKSVMLINFGDEALVFGLNMLSKLRAAGIRSEIYPENDKLKKQFRYADQKKFSFVMMAGSDEISRDVFSLKNLENGEQTDVKTSEVINYLSKD